LGGTIAMTASDGGGVIPALSADQLVAAVPGLVEAGIAVDVEDFRQVPGASLTFEDIRALADAVQQLLSRGLISAGFLHPLKARILLHTLITMDSDRATVAAAFAAAGSQLNLHTWPWPVETSPHAEGQP
jgi:L-asparaginase/Glu-tRNA(Gln) amidotransferase subunit D